MARAYPQTDYADAAHEPGAGDWQALRGELVALLDQVESRFGASASPANGLSNRVKHLRDQVGNPDNSNRRREALKSVKRAVDRFNHQDDDADDLTAAINEIRSRQGPSSVSLLDRRAADMPDYRELSGLVSGMGDRLGRLEGQLRSVRSGSDDVREVASQVEQLTQVVELLAGAVGETGQVKRLEKQIAALGAMIEEGPRVDLSAVNARLDDVSNTVAKLAELQAQQMEREIVREERADAAPKGKGMAKLEPAMASIEANVRSVYDRIDAIERNMSISSGDFERLTGEMAAVTQALRDTSANPDLLVSRVDALAERLEHTGSGSGDVRALKDDIAALKQAVIKGMEPRFARIESQLEVLSTKVAPVDTGAVESQLKRLMARMDEAGAQLDGLARLYHDGGDKPDFEQLATLVAERTSDAMSRKAPAPVAMFGPESLKTIEDRISSLVRSVSKTPDADTLAQLIAEKASAAVAKSGASAPAFNPEGFEALEKRMTAVFNTAGKDTAERLARLEAALANRTAAPAPVAAAKVETPAPAKAPAYAEDEDIEVQSSRLDQLLSRLDARQRDDAMPSNPADEAPLVDRGFPETPKAKAAAPVAAPRPAAKPAPKAEVPAFDPEKVERPPRPQSSFAAAEKESFGAPRTESAPAVEAPQSNTSTFVAAARRAQRARQEQPAPAAGSDSIIGRALARVKPQAKAETAEAVTPAAPKPEKRRPRKPAPEVAVEASAEADDAQPSFLTRYRRPLLLTAALVAVSMLTLNLVLQRMREDAPAPAVVESSEVDPAPAATPTSISVDPTPSTETSELIAPRVIDMVDATATGAINPGERMSFSRAPEVTPMPPALFAEQVKPATTAAETIIEENPVIGAVNSAEPETFELPPEAVGPEPMRQAAADGDARAQFEIAAIYTEGRAVPADPKEAAVWYERSAAQGFAPAQYRLGNLYEAGTGVEKDLEMARLWYQRSAEAGNRMAMHNLAALYASGLLGEQQFSQAAEWFERAAQRGMTDSQFNLGMLYARGLGVEQDFEKSYKWFSLAAKRGDADSAKARDDIAKSLTADAVSRITAEVDAWKAEPIELEANFAPIGTWMKDFNPGDAITNKEVIARVQEVLTRLGYDIGTPDGVAGPKTAEAIKTFERGTGMNETGKINPRLLAVLGSQPV